MIMGEANPEIYTTHSFKRKQTIALSIPVINVIATIAVGHSTASGFFNPGTIRAALLFVLFFMIFRRGLPSNCLVLPTYIMLFVVFFSCLVSIDFFSSFYIYLRFVIASLLFVVGFYAFKTKIHLARLNRVMMIVLGMQVIYVLISNIFQFGSSDYLEESFYFGETGVNITKEMVVGVFIAPLFFSLEKNRFVRIVSSLVLIAALIIIFIGLKRAALLSVAAGVLVYVFLSPRKMRAIKSILLGVVLLALLSPYFVNLIYERYEARSKKVSMSLEELDEEEGRVVEMSIVWWEFTQKNVVEKLIGTGPFLTKKDYFGLNRIVHIDYLSLLDGSGIIGLLVYLWVYFSMYIFMKQYTSYRKNVWLGELKTIGIALIVIQLIMGIAGTIIGIGLRGLILFYLGAICGLLRTEYLLFRKESEITFNHE